MDEIYQEAIQTNINLEIPQIQTVMQEGLPPISSIINAPFVEVTSVNGMTGDVQVEAIINEFQTNHYYKAGTPITHNGNLKIAREDFTSSSTYSESDWLTPTFNQEQADWNESDTTSNAYIKNKPQNLVQDASYVHTDENYTANEKSKLSGIASGAEVNVQSDWTESDDSSDAFIKNKPTLFVQSNVKAGDNINISTSGNDVTISRVLDSFAIKLNVAFGVSGSGFSHFDELASAISNGLPVTVVWSNLTTLADSAELDTVNGTALLTFDNDNVRYKYLFYDNGTFTATKPTKFIKDYMLDDGQIGRMVLIDEINPASIPTGTDSTPDAQRYRLKLADYFKHPETSNLYFDKVKVRFNVQATAGSDSGGYIRFGGVSSSTTLRHSILLAPSDATPLGRTGSMPNIFFRFGRNGIYNVLDLDFSPKEYSNREVTQVYVTSTEVPPMASQGYQMLSFGSRIILGSDGATGIHLSDGLTALSAGDYGYIKVYGIKYASIESYES